MLRSKHLIHYEVLSYSPSHITNPASCPCSPSKYHSESRAGIPQTFNKLHSMAELGREASVAEIGH